MSKQIYYWAINPVAMVDWVGWCRGCSIREIRKFKQSLKQQVVSQIPEKEVPKYVLVDYIGINSMERSDTPRLEGQLHTVFIAIPWQTIVPLKELKKHMEELGIPFIENYIDIQNLRRYEKSTPS
jgi:hypothetical protein